MESQATEVNSNQCSTNMAEQSPVQNSEKTQTTQEALDTAVEIVRNYISTDPPTEGLVGQYDYSTNDEDKFQAIWKAIELPEHMRESYNFAFFFIEVMRANNHDREQLRTAPNPYKYIKETVEGTVGIYLLKRETIDKMIATNHMRQGFQQDDGTRFGTYNQKGYMYQGLVERY